MSIARWPGEQLVPVICPRCETQRGPVSTFIAAQIERSGCAGCFAAYADELAGGPRARAVRLGIHLVGDDERPTSSSSTCDPVEKEEVQDDDVAATRANPDPPKDLQVSPAAGQAPASPDSEEGEDVDRQQKEELEQLLVDHVSIVDAAKDVGVPHVEARVARDELRDQGVKCGCGKSLGHRGACKGAGANRSRPKAPRATPPKPETPVAWGDAVGVKLQGHEEFLRALDHQEREMKALIARVSEHLEQIAKVREGVEKLVELEVG